MPAANRLLAMEEGDRGECERFIQESTNDAVHLSGRKGPEKLRRIVELTEQWQSQ